jgi:hypothetical protein
VVDSKGVHAVNGLETSSFVVCARIRPVLPSDLNGADDGKSFPCVLAGPIRNVRTEQGLSHSEEAIVCTPKVSDSRNQPCPQSLVLILYRYARATPPTQERTGLHTPVHQYQAHARQTALLGLPYEGQP